MIYYLPNSFVGTLVLKYLMYFLRYWLGPPKHVRKFFGLGYRRFKMQNCLGLKLLPCKMSDTLFQKKKKILRDQFLVNLNSKP